MGEVDKMVLISEGARDPLLVIPALDPNTPYVSRLSARSALYTELRLLLDDHRHAFKSEEYRRLVVERNCLARKSSSARAKLWKELRSRYRLDAADPIFSAFWSEWRRCRSDQERGLTVYILFALNDRLVADLGTEWLFPLLRRAPAELRVAEVLEFIGAKSRRGHPEVLTWSVETTNSTAQKYCTSLRDFGLATGTVHKKSIRPALYGAPVRLLIRALRLAGCSPLEIVSASIFRLLGIDSSEVIDALGELNRIGALRFRIQGDIVELDLVEAA
jgi:hypothetical protein